MMGHSHRVLGAAVFLGAIPALPHNLISLAVTGGVAVASSSGRMLSPDADLGWLWQFADRLIPDEAILDDNGPMQHRGISHFWAWPLLAWLLSMAPLVVDVGSVGHSVAVSASPVLTGLALGWGSHLLGDFLVGARGNGRGPGIPLAPWWWWVGTGARCGGIAEAAATVLALPCGAWWAVGHPGVAQALALWH